MSTELLLKGFFVLFMSVAMAYQVWETNDRDLARLDPEHRRRQMMPLVSAVLLPMMFLLLGGLSIAQEGPERAMRDMTALAVQMLISISIYDGVLLFLLPRLRGWLHPNACATLWLLPNYLYITLYSFMRVGEPLLVIKLPVWLSRWFFRVWLLGFLAIFLWNTLTHLRVRRTLLAQGVEVTQPEILAIWQEEKESLGLQKRKLRLVRSPAVNTPLTIGLFARSMRVVLPERDYSPEELHLILRHELIHIGREDSWMKFFLLFCISLCWFIPPMWQILARSGEDMELCCDELVLDGATEETRYRYATLLLRTAGESRGYTTCLSADGAALRYRLKAVMELGKRRAGGLVVGAAFFLLLMCSGAVSLSFPVGTVQEQVFTAGELGEYRLLSLSEDTGTLEERTCLDPAAFTAYLAGLELEERPGDDGRSSAGREWIAIYETPWGTQGMVLTDQQLRLVKLHKEGETKVYFLAKRVDWTYLDGLTQ